jgi:hypothetical protein
VGSSFQVNSSGDLTKIKGVSYGWPNVQGGGNTILTNDGNGGLSWAPGGSGIADTNSSGMVPSGTYSQSTGSWTFGTIRSLNYQGPGNRIVASLFSATPTSPNSDQSGYLEIGNNVYRTPYGNRFSATTGGASISFLNRTTDNTEAIQFLVNRAGEPITADATIIGSANQLGEWSFGQTGSNFTGLHTFNSGATFNFKNSPQTSPTTIAGYNNNIIQFTGNKGSTDRTGIFGTVSGLPVGIGFERVDGGNWQTDIAFKAHPSATGNITTLTEIGRASGEGAWTFGSSTAISNTHVFQGIQTNVAYSALTDGQTSGYRANAGLSPTNSWARTAYIGVYKHGGISKPSAFIALDRSEDTNIVPYYFWVGSDGVFYTSSVASTVGTTGGQPVGSQTSDERLKQDITPTKYGLNEILMLRPIDFTMHGKHKVGFGAQTTRPIIPEAVFDTSEPVEGYSETKLAMDYSTITPILVKAVQELKAELDAAKAEIQALKAAQQH